MTAASQIRMPLRPGDIVFVDLDPVRGSEQAGQRPALVISAVSFNAASNRAIVCPITSNTSKWPTKVILGSEAPVQGAILVDQVRALHRQSRGFRPMGRVSDAVVDEVRAILLRLIGVDPTGLAVLPEGT